jgi:hypothetical protein
VRLRDPASLAARQLNAASAELRAAHGLDAAADRAATAAGRPLPEERVAAGATEALELAERRHAAARQNQRDSLFELLHGINRDCGVWLTEQLGVEEALQADLRKALAQVTALFTDLARERRILATLREFPTQGATTLVNWGRPGRLDERYRESTEAEAAAKVANQTGNMDAWIPRQMPYLLAELRRQIEAS